MHKLTLLPLLGYDNETIREIAAGYFISSLINIHTISSHVPKFFCLPKFMESIIFTFIGTFVLTSPRSSFLVPHHMAPSFQNCEFFFCCNFPTKKCELIKYFTLLEKKIMYFTHNRSMNNTPIGSDIFSTYPSDKI